jgi:F-type H+-transporting ATPase subunit delta
MKISRESRNEAKRLFRACCPGGRVDESKVRTVVKALSEQKPRNYLAILSYFEKLLTLQVTAQTHIVEASSPLPDSGASIFATLSKKFGAPLATRYQVKPELLGGLRLQVGSTVYDGSIRTALTQFTT